MKTAANIDPKVRLNLDLTPRAKELLEDLQRRTEATSLVEVVRRAIALYDLAVTHTQQQGSISLEAADGTKERLRIL